MNQALQIQWVRFALQVFTYVCFINRRYGAQCAPYTASTSCTSSLRFRDINTSFMLPTRLPLP